MRAATFQGVGNPLEIKEVDDPTPGATDLVLKVKSCGICGTDLHASGHAPGLPTGTVMGHEFAGEVVEVGSGVGSAFRLGDRVCSLPFIGCGRCALCLAGDLSRCTTTRTMGLGDVPGGYAEYVRVGASESLKLPDAVSDRQGAIVEPMAVGLHAVNMAKLQPGSNVLVIGAGPIGLTTALWARFFGSRRVVVSERAAGRRNLAGSFGATDAIDPSNEDVAESFARIAGGPPDVIFECVGVPGLIQECVRLAPVRGKVVIVGLCMQPDNIVPGIAVIKELSLQFVVAYHKSDFALAISMLEQGRVASTEMVTDVVDFARFADAFDGLRTPSDQCKVILEP